MKIYSIQYMVCTFAMDRGPHDIPVPKSRPVLTLDEDVNVIVNGEVISLFRLTTPVNVDMVLFCGGMVCID